MKPNTAPFPGFDPAARTLLRELADNQTASWFERNKARYEDLIRTPMASLVDALDVSFARSGVPLKGRSAASLLPASLDRRPRDRRPRYRTAAVAILTSGGGRESPGSLRIDYGADVARLTFGFHGLIGSWREGFAPSTRAEPERWRAVERALAGAGLDAGAGLAAAVKRAGETRGLTLEACADIEPAAFDSGDIVPRITSLAVAATPLLRLGAELIPESLGRRVSIGVTSLG